MHNIDMQDTNDRVKMYEDIIKTFPVDGDGVICKYFKLSSKYGYVVRRYQEALDELNKY